MQQLSEAAISNSQFEDPQHTQERVLQKRVAACLESRHPELAGVDVTTIGRTVIFQGDSLTAEEKHRLYECCRHIPGVSRVMEKTVVFAQSVVAE